MKVVVAGRWNKHSSEHPPSKELWNVQERYDIRGTTPGELWRTKDELTKFLLRRIKEIGVSVVSDGGFRYDSVYDIARRIMGCGGFSQLTRIPETNHFHRQPEIHPVTFPWGAKPNGSNPNFIVASTPIDHGNFKECNGIKGELVWRPLILDDLSFLKQNTDPPVVICLPGPYSLAKQTRYSGGEGYFNALSSAYAKVLNQEIKSLILNGADLVRIEDPQILFHPQDWNLFKELMSELTRDADASKIALATWFGSVNHLPGYFDLPFGTFFVDFVEGRESILALSEFPKDKTLVAGIFDARHTYEETEDELLRLLSQITTHVPEENILISTNTDPHFLPWNEAEQKVRRMVGFAKKYPVVPSLKHKAEKAKKTKIPMPLIRVLPPGKEIRETFLSKLSEKKFITSAVGSFPQTKEIRTARKKLREGQFDRFSYEIMVARRTREWLDFQVNSGLSVPVDGEFLRSDMAEYFLTYFGGKSLDFIPSYENRRYRPVEICQKISSPEPFVVKEYRRNLSLTLNALPIKITFTGPATLADWTILKNPAYYHDRMLLRKHLVEELRKEMKVLISAGANCIQIDEPALTTKMGVLAEDLWAIYDTVQGFENKAYFVLHICYSDMEALDAAFPHLLRLPFHQIHMEMANRNYTMLDLIKKYGFAGKDIGLGVTDVHTDRVETPEEIINGVERVLALKDVFGAPYFTPENVWLLPDCGLKERSDEIAKTKLRVMVEAAKILREKYN